MKVFSFLVLYVVFRMSEKGNVHVLKNGVIWLNQLLMPLYHIRGYTRKQDVSRH
jgi:hypothetical protein